ncbi:transmembrane protein 247 [Calonectris borealis]|uniref:transmembrane protein 247 n=1 Tax=Calonectris borealis TaxID=1323832 RepID=UPI003F4B6636
MTMQLDDRRETFLGSNFWGIQTSASENMEWDCEVESRSPSCELPAAGKIEEKVMEPGLSKQQKTCLVNGTRECLKNMRFSNLTYETLSFWNIPGDALTSVEVSHVETGTLFAKDQEIQGDLEELSDLEGSEYSLQTAMEELEENQREIQLTLQDPQNNDNKKQQHEKMQGAIRDMTTPSFISDSKTESVDAKWHMAHLDMKGGTSALQSEVSTNAEELEQLCGKQVTAADIEIERMKWDFVLAKLKYEHEDNEKQRLHEERMEQIHQQAVERSFSQGLQDLLWPPNQYALFLYCFIIIHVIYTAKELAFYFLQTHYLFCFAIVLFFILKKIFQDHRNKKKCS